MIDLLASVVLYEWTPKSPQTGFNEPFVREDALLRYQSGPGGEVLLTIARLGLFFHHTN